MKKYFSNKKIFKQWGLYLVLALFYTFISIFIYPKYNTEKEDQNFYTPAILKNADNTLFNRDFLFFSAQTKYSFYDEFIGFFVNDVDDLYYVYFYFSIFIRVIFFLGIILICQGISKNFYFSLLCPIIFILTHSGYICNTRFPESWLFSFGVELHARSFVISFLCLALGFLCVSNFFMTWILTLFSLPMHFITAFPFLIFLIIYQFSRFYLFNKTKINLNFFFKNLHIKSCKKNLQKIFSKNLSQKFFIKNLFYASIIFFIIFCLYFLTQISISNFLKKIDPEWFEFIQKYDYLFIENFFLHLNNNFKVTIPIILFYLIFQNSKNISNHTKQILKYICLMFAICLIFYFIGFKLLGFVIFVQLQLFRFLIFIKLILITGLTYHFLAEFIKNKKLNAQSLCNFLALISFLGNFYSFGFIFFIIYFQQILDLHKNKSLYFKNKIISFFENHKKIFKILSWLSFFVYFFYTSFFVRFLDQSKFTNFGEYISVVFLEIIKILQDNFFIIIFILVAFYTCKAPKKYLPK